MSRLVVVGSGTVVPEADRGGACHFVEMGASRVLLDCGPGAVQGMARLGIPWGALTDLVLTHFHADHVGDVPALFFALKHGLHPRTRSLPLTVWGPPGTLRLFQGLAAALGPFLLEPGFPVDVREVEPGGQAELGEGLRLRTHKTPHTEESQAVRLDGGVSVGYTGDTGPSASLGPFMSGTAVLLCECSLLDEEVGDNHLSPSRVAEIASVARPGRLLLTHVYPHVRARHDVAALVREAGCGTSAVELARDGLSLRLDR